MADVSDNVKHIVAKIEDGTDPLESDWAREWHENNCHLWVPEGQRDEGDEPETLEDHMEWCSEHPTAWNYLEGALDIEYVVSSDREYLGARVLVAFGGPNIWINTRTNTVEGYWWNDEFHMRYADNLGLDDALEDLWKMG